MSRKIILDLALSEDRFIAQKDGSVNWLLGESQEPDIDRVIWILSTQLVPS